MKSLISLAALAAAMVAASSADALAENKKAPISVTSDHGEVHNQDCTSIWTGSAEALMDTSRLRADTMIAHMEILKGKKPPAGSAPGAAASNDCGEMTTLEAKGSVYYAAPDGRRVHGDNGFYDSASTTMTITGDVTAVNGQNVMRGTKMVYNTQTGEGHVEGGGTGVAAKNRPRGVFYPKDATADSGAQASPTQGAPTQTDPPKTDKKKKGAQ